MKGFLAAGSPVSLAGWAVLAISVSKDPREEQLQKFIEDNPTKLHQFAAPRLFPRTLTFFTADFGLVSPQKELVLIEIERAGT